MEAREARWPEPSSTRQAPCFAMLLDLRRLRVAGLRLALRPCLDGHERCSLAAAVLRSN